LTVARDIINEGGVVSIYDPMVNKAHFISMLLSYFPGYTFSEELLEFAADPYSACIDCQLLAIMTEWNE